MLRQAVAATVQRIQKASSHSPQTKFNSNRLLLVGSGVAEPSNEVAAELESLSVAAESAATSVLCSSILAGHTSESDDFGDAAIWLGQGAFGKGHEQAVLKSLGLEGGKVRAISSIELSPKTCIPVTVNASTSTPELKALSAKLADLQDLHCFSLEPASGSDVIFSLVGKNASGWGGLVGIGIWSDE
ncbi:hypothetical protein C8F04DRAFT_1034023 [Mycena alexandri]|uniref:Uncharacterized protein n=1 Tax=Mycena alexandri TaxID=1745969 RepID=A0AAD6T8G6_9AGAR|nr:hypothetical protein C8F04DRAFT_1034023 [Mycena alexandri]